jgi:hypothetical protein
VVPARHAGRRSPTGSPAVPDGPAPPGTPAHSRRGRLAPAAVIAVYLLATLWLFHRVGTATTRLPVCACGDQINQVWFLALAHSWVTTGHISLLSARIDYPAGINVLDNASLPLLGVLMTPVTATIGPVGSFLLLARLAFVLSAASAYLVLRRLVHSELAAAAGGALYGFSPYMTHQGGSHMFLAFVPLPPVMLYLLYRRLADPGNGRPLATGLLLGLLAVVQYLIASEVLISTALVALLVAAVLAAGELLARRPVGARLRTAARMAGGAAVVAVPLLAYPAWFALAGPRHVSGPTQLVTSPGISVAATVLPSDRALVAGTLTAWRVGATQYLGDTAYLGPALVVLCVVVAVAARRSPLVRVSAALGAVAWVLALGPRLVVERRVSTIPLPFAPLTHVPVLQDLVPSRLTLYVALAAAALLAVAVDRLVAHVRAHPARSVVGLAAAAGAASLVLPSVSYPAPSTGAAAAFASGGALDRAIPDGAVVLSYPYPLFPEDDAMLWQADDDMRFSLLGGYAVRPLGHQAAKTPPLLAPVAVEALLLDAWPDHQLTDGVHVSPADAARALPTFVRRHHVSAVIVDDAGRDPGRVIRLFSDVYGPPRHFGPIELWTDLGATPPTRG